MMTQYISIGRTGVTELVLNMSYRAPKCEGNCSKYVEVKTYETSLPDEEGRSKPTSYSEEGAARVYLRQGPAKQLTNQVIPISGSSTGLYLAVVDPPPGSCLTITRVVLFYYVCPEQELNFVIYPEVIAPTSLDSDSIQVVAVCSENAVLTSQTQLLECKYQGRWEFNNASCECVDDHFKNISSLVPCKHTLNVQIPSSVYTVSIGGI